MNICIYIFHHNGANEIMTWYYLLLKFLVEVVVIKDKRINSLSLVVMICPGRVATLGNGGILHGGALTLKVHTPL